MSREDVSGLSVRNRLRGRVRRLVSLAGATFVAIDIGLADQEIWAELTPQAAEELQREPGCDVTCLLKAHSLRIVS